MGDHGHSLLGEGESGGFISKTHCGQCEVAKEKIIFRLLFEKGFQFAPSLSPTFLGGGISTVTLSLVTREFIA